MNYQISNELLEDELDEFSEVVLNEFSEVGLDEAEEMGKLNIYNLAEVFADVEPIVVGVRINNESL